MSRRSIEKKISEKLGIEVDLVNKIIQHFAAGIFSDCVNGEHVTLRGFGTFEMAWHKKKVVYTNGKMFQVPARRVLKFRPGKRLHISMEPPPVK
jgi:nucleoid DNA-binding protein